MSPASVPSGSPEAAPERRRGTASGKVILFGEHAVVYGKPAIAASIDRGAVAEAQLVDESRARIELTDATGVPVATTVEEQSSLQRAYRALLDAGEPVPPLHIIASTSLPPGGGLGSSAALGVAIARAVEGFRSKSAEAVLVRADAWESVFHGKASGVDTRAAAGHGPLWFEPGSATRPVAVPCDLWLCIGLTAERGNTRDMVSGVRALHDRKPEMVKTTLDGIASIVRNAKTAIEHGDRIALGRLFDLNQMLLAGLFVSTDRLETLCSLAREAGALGAKLTGAGGGGAVIALCPGTDGDARPDGCIASILGAWRTAGFDGFAARIGGYADETSRGNAA